MNLKIFPLYRVAENVCQKLLNSIKTGFRYPFRLYFGGKCSASETESFKISPLFDLLTNFCCGYGEFGHLRGVNDSNILFAKVKEIG